MFQLETPNIRFKHRDICSKEYWGQRSPKVIQGHLGSLSVKNKIIAIPLRFFTFFQNLKHSTLAYNQRKSSDHIMF